MLPRIPHANQVPHPAQIPNDGTHPRHRESRSHVGQTPADDTIAIAMRWKKQGAHGRTVGEQGLVKTAARKRRDETATDTEHHLHMQEGPEGSLPCACVAWLMLFGFDLR